MASKEFQISKSKHKIFRVLLGVIAAALLLLGGAMYFLQPDTNPLVVGLLIRVGSLLSVICLAYPELVSLKARMPTVIYGLLLVCVILIAVRPKLSRVVILLLTVGVGVGAVMKWMQKVIDNDPRNRK